MGTHPPFEERPGIRRVNIEKGHEESAHKWTPVSQQAIDSHVATPALIALIVAIVVTGMVGGIMLKWFSPDPFILLMVFCLAFLVVFLKRIGVADKVLWAIEGMFNIDIDQDGKVGYAPRSVPVTTKNGTRDVPLNNQKEELYREDWAQVAIAILNRRANVSWRGIYNNCDLSQSKSQLAAQYLKKGYSYDLEINGRGWDFLIAHLPQYVDCLIERPTSPTDAPPTPSDGGWEVVAQGVNQPTNQPTS